MTTTITTPADIGKGGAHLAPGGASGSPDLKTVLDNHKTVIDETVARATALEAGIIQKRTVTIGHADLTAAVNGEVQSFNIGEVLPANARILGTAIKVATPITGGALASCAIDVGTVGDADALVDGADVFSAAVDGMAASMTLGIAPFKHFAAAGAQLLAKVIPDAGHALEAATAGSVTVDVMFVVLP